MNDSPRKLQAFGEMPDQAQTHGLIQSFQEIIYCCDTSGYFTFLNPAWTNILGYSTEQSHGHHISEFIVDDDQNKASDLFRLSSNRTNKHIELRFLHQNGEHVWLSLIGLKSNEQGSIGSLCNISSHKSATEKMHSLARFPNENPNPVIRYDSNGNTLFVNAAAQYMLSNINHDHTTQKKNLAPLHWQKHIKAALQSGKPREFEETYGGKVLYCFMTPVPEAQYVNVYAHDITQLKQNTAELKLARDKAMSASEAKSGCLSMMSHELRTPLNSIIGFSTLLLKNREEHFSKQELLLLDRIHENGSQLSDIINDVLNLSKLQAGEVKIKTYPIHLHGMLQEILQQVGPIQAGVSLNIKIPDKLEPVHTDPRKLQLALSRIISNALKFTENGIISIGIKTIPDTNQPFSIEISDTGIGIKADVLNQIFEPFYQIDSSEQRKYGGSGLGLAVAHTILKILGGSVEVDSEPGVGSTFRIILPKCEPSTDGVRCE